MKRISLAFAALILALTTFAFNVTEAAPTQVELAKSDSLKTLVEDQAVLWRDGNISTGTTALSVVKITSTLPATKAEWNQFVVDLFNERFKYFVEADVPKDARLRISAAPLEAKHLLAAANAVAESNAYNTSAVEAEEILKEVKKLVAALGDSKLIQFAAIKTRLMDEDVIQAKRNVRIHTFVNKKTSVAILIFTVEGTM